MLDKFLVFYASLMFVMGLAVLFLLISAEIADKSLAMISASNRLRVTKENKIMSPNSSPAQPTKDLPAEISPDKSGRLKISTDKSTYAAAEEVKIIFENRATAKLIQKVESDLLVKSRSGLGKNFEVAFIEYHNGSDWVAMEPVKRCSEECNQPCNNQTSLNAADQETFVWDQKLLECKEGKAKKLSAPTGEYRISSGTWDEASSITRPVYSEIFKISGLSKK